MWQKSALSMWAAGVFDWCLENGVKFDYGIGISAGSANLASYLSGQRGRNYLFYEEYSMRRQYMGAGNMLRSGSFLNLQYIYGTLSNAGCENPLDFEKMSANPMEWYMVATDATTGKPKYFTRSDMHQDDYRVLMASCCTRWPASQSSLTASPITTARWVIRSP